MFDKAEYQRVWRQQHPNYHLTWMHDKRTYERNVKTQKSRRERRETHEKRAVAFVPAKVKREYVCDVCGRPVAEKTVYREGKKLFHRQHFVRALPDRRYPALCVALGLVP